MKQLKFIGNFFFFLETIKIIFRDEIEKKLLKYKDDYYKEQDFGVFGKQIIIFFWIVLCP